MKKLIWLAVDSNGDEKITSNVEGWQRFYPKFYQGIGCDRKRQLEEQNKVVSFDDTQSDHNIWIEYHNPKDTPKTGVIPHWIYVPKGTIEKILGNSLTWNDEPVKIEENT